MISDETLLILAAKYDPLELLDILGIENEDLLSRFVDKVEENLDIFIKDIGDVYEFY